jgi:hypothetical protein
MKARRFGGSAVAVALVVGLTCPLLACSSGASRPGLEGIVDAATRDAGSTDATSDGAPVQGEAGPGDDATASSDAAGAGDTGVAPGDDGGPGDATGDDGAVFGPPPPPPACTKNAAWGTGAPLDLSTPGDDLLDALTPDELSIVWTVVNGAAKAIHYADRASTAGAFAAQSLPAGLFTNARVALSADGLRLVVVNADGQGFSQIARATRGDAFDPNAALATAAGYDNFAGVLAPGQSYGDPVLAASDTAFFYSVYGGGADGGQADAGAPTIFRAARLRPTDAWPAGAPLASSTGLLPQGALRRRPTGLSSDQQTLFFWDEITGSERAAWMDAQSATGAFDSFVDLGTRSLAVPSASCGTLYFSAQGASSIDLFSATSH